MGLRLRKSINLGNGFKINLSKSGIGYSWGVPGFRYTHTAKGRSRQTFSIPGTGISYTTESGQKRKANTSTQKRQNVPSENSSAYTEEAVKLGTGDISTYQGEEYQLFLNAIKRYKCCNLVANILMLLLLFCAVEPLILALFIVGVILKVVTIMFLRIPVEYEFDDYAKEKYQQQCDRWISLNKSKKLWQIISSAKVTQKKQAAGADSLVKRKDIKIKKAVPRYLKTDLKFISIKLQENTIYLLPDKILIENMFKVGAISYEEVDIKAMDYSFIEDEGVPKDAERIGTTWLKVNKNGTPDMRYKGNRQIPICKYGLIKIASKDSMDIRICCSNYRLIEAFK